MPPKLELESRVKDVQHRMVTRYSAQQPQMSDMSTHNQYLSDKRGFLHCIWSSTRSLARRRRKVGLGAGPFGEFPLWDIQSTTEPIRSSVAAGTPGPTSSPGDIQGDHNAKWLEFAMLLTSKCCHLSNETVKFLMPGQFAPERRAVHGRRWSLPIPGSIQINPFNH